MISHHVGLTATRLGVGTVMLAGGVLLVGCSDQTVGDDEATVPAWVAWAEATADPRGVGDPNELVRGPAFLLVADHVALVLRNGLRSTLVT